MHNLFSGKHSTTTARRSRSRLPRWLRPHFCGSLSDPAAAATMSEGQQSRADRMARYKEERRRQLAVQFSNNTTALTATTSKSNSKKTNNQKDAAAAVHSSSSDGTAPRTTRTSRLRAATKASSQDNNHCSPNLSLQVNKVESLEVGKYSEL